MYIDDTREPIQGAENASDIKYKYQSNPLHDGTVLVGGQAGSIHTRGHPGHEIFRQISNLLHLEALAR